MRFHLAFKLLAALALLATPLAAQYTFPGSLTFNGVTTTAQDQALNVSGVPAGNYGTYVVTVNWSAPTGDPYSTEAQLSITDGATTTYVSAQAPTSGAQNSTAPVTITFSGTFAGTYVGGNPLTIRAVQTYDLNGSTANWANVTVQITAISTTYIPPTFTNPGATGDFASRIQLNTSPPFDQTITDRATDFLYHTGVGATFIRGASYVATVTNNPVYDGGIGAWMDYNDDGDYADANEYLGATAVLGAGAVGTIMFTVPASVSAQPATRIRFIQVWNAVPADPVGNYGYGQAEDYDAVIQVPTGPEIDILGPGPISVAVGGTYNHATALVGGTAGTPISFVIQNLGVANLTIASATLTGTAVSCAPNITTAPTSPINPSANTTLGVTVNPAAGIGTWSFQFTVVNNDSDEGNYVVNVAGTRGMVGTFTCANGNPAAAFDYGDIGAFLADLTTFDAAGAVTLELYDDGGAFTSAASYAFDSALAGLTASSSLTIAAPSGETPVINGGAAGDGFALGTHGLSLQGSFVTVSGVTFVGAGDAGLCIGDFYSTGINTITVTRCIFRNCGFGIIMWGYGSAISNVTITNNFVVNCGATAGGWSTALTYSAGLYLNSIGSGSVVRHNSVLINNGLTATRGVEIDNSFFAVTLSAFEYNIVSVTSNGGYCISDVQGGSATSWDRNLYHFSGTAAFDANASTFATWQGLGYDTNSPNPTDPNFVSASVGSEDLHLTIASTAALDLAAGSALAVDIDGDARPFGTAADLGADEATSLGAPEIMVFDAATAGTNLNDPATLTGVNVGLAATVLTFRIENDAAATANLIMPTNPVTASVTVGAGTVGVTIGQPGSLSLAAGTSTTFTVTISATGSATGNAYTVEIDLANNDSNENPFDIDVSGTATANNAPRGNPETTVSSPVFTGTADTGPFSFSADPGTSVSSTIIIDDADTDDVQVVSITGGTQAGITPTATLATLAASQNVDFTGSIDPAAAPGVYTWTIDLEDDQTPAGTRTITVNITVNNIAPDGFTMASTGTGGDGIALGSAYTRSFNQTTTVAATDLFDVTDANTGQTLAITSANRTGGTTATTFPFDGQFAIAGATGNFTVSVSTAGALVATDVGTHEYDVVITDGTSPITVFVTITVVAQTPPTITANATGVSIGQGGSMSAVNVATVSDAQDAATALSVTATSVPTGITVSAISVDVAGVVTCTITVGAAFTPGAATIDFTVTDTLSLTDVDTYSFTVVANNLPTITAGTAISMGQNVTLTSQTVATVSDVEDAAGTLSVIATVVPPGITIGTITNTTGTITADVTSSAAIVAGVYNVTFQVTDSQGATNTANLQITIVTGSGGGGGGGGSGGGGGGCVAGNGTSGWMAMLAVLGLFGLATRLRRVRA